MSHNLLLVSIADKLFRLCLFLYPKSFRQRFGDEMVQVFGDDTRQTLMEHGTLGWVGLCFRVFFDLLITAFAERTREGIPMSLDKVTRFSGVAAFGAPLMILSGVSPAFWDFVTSLRQFLGLSIRHQPYMFQFFAVSGTVLMAYALLGLYRRLSGKSNLRITALFGLSIISCLVLIAISLTLFTQNWPDAVFFAMGAIVFFTQLIGIGGMGWITWRNRTLGYWSFAPLLIVVTLSSFWLLALVENVPEQHPVVNLGIVLHTLAWWALGIGLLMIKRDEVKPKLREAEMMA